MSVGVGRGCGSSGVGYGMGTAEGWARFVLRWGKPEGKGEMWVGVSVWLEVRLV